MKFFTSLVSYGLLATSFVSAVAIPAPAPAPEDAQLSRRAVDVAGAIAIVETLFASVQEQTKIINATTDGLGPNPSLGDKAAALAVVNEAITKIAGLITGATTDIGVPTPAKRQLPELPPLEELTFVLGALVANLILELSGVLTTIINALGYAGLAISINLLLLAVQGLLAALLAVVGQLLLVVAAILGSLVAGLNPLLGGIIPFPA